VPNQTATFACGCFWGVQARFDNLEGVIKTTVGYTGGHTSNPSYEQVCRGNTGHAEAIEIQYNPKLITFHTLLNLFFQHHDPTTFHRQGPDVGSQYRSAIFYHTHEQKEQAIRLITKLSPEHNQPIVTEIQQASIFHPAEAYHQYYYKKNPNSCS
jgi:peptide-methionine (S)-S-oxide reductase